MMYMLVVQYEDMTFGKKRRLIIFSKMRYSFILQIDEMQFVKPLLIPQYEDILFVRQTFIL